jgi:hypothetical protein
LKIGDAARHSKALAALISQATNQIPGPTAGLPAQASPMVMQNMYGHHPPLPFYGFPPYIPPYPPSFSPPQITSYVPPLTPYATCCHSRYYGGENHEMPSSDPPEELEDLSSYPLIRDWLQILDDGPHGRDGHHFSHFAEDLEKEKFICVCDLENLSKVALSALCPGIAKGAAVKLLHFAEKETKRIRKEELKQSRH